MNFYGCFYYDVRKNSPKIFSQKTTQTELPNSILNKIESFGDFETQKELVEDIVEHGVDMIEDINDIKEKYADYQKTHNNKDVIEIENDTRKIVQDGEIIYDDAKKLNWFSWILGE